MIYDENELLGEIDNYFDNITKEEFLKDLEKTNSLDMTEEVK